MVRLVVVTGSGRSGTSSVAGTLKRLGLHVPQPEVPADERNPRGYYETQWVADWHKDWLNAIPVRTIDTRPHAGDIAMADVTPEREAELRDWLAAELAAHGAGASAPAVMIKETRAYWVLPLWERVADATGATLSTLTMLRHPSQVVRSRDAAYLSHHDDDFRRQRESANVAAWLNSVLVTERATRDLPRAFVPYHDLIGDWRAAMTRVDGQLGLGLDVPGAGTHHAADDFVTPGLNRSADTWEGLAVSAALRDLAEATWTAAGCLVVDPHDARARADLDALRTSYDELFAMAAAITSEEVTAQVAAFKVRFQGRLRWKNNVIRDLRAELAQLRKG